jgi:hypothetical protein
LINQKDDNDGLISSIIQNNITFPNYNQGLLWEHKNGILNLLKDSLLDNTKPLFAQFKQQNNNSKTGKINTLMRSLGNYADVAQNKNVYLQNLNSIGAATNVVEQNYQTFMAEYITNVVGVSNTSANSISVMKQLAQKCPYSDGAVVYNARALLKVWGDNEAYFNACEIATLPDEKVARQMITPMQDNTFTQNVLVYPNPTNGEFSIAYAFENTSNTFELYDIMGKIAFSKTLIGSTGVETVATSDLVTGIYFYKITDYTGKIAFTGKLVINK